MAVLRTRQNTTYGWKYHFYLSCNLPSDITWPVRWLHLPSLMSVQNRIPCHHSLTRLQSWSLGGDDACLSSLSKCSTSVAYLEPDWSERPKLDAGVLDLCTDEQAGLTPSIATERVARDSNYLPQPRSSGTIPGKQVYRLLEPSTWKW